MQETQCPQCGEWLGVPPEFADRPVRCGSCGRVIHPLERHSAPPPPPRTPPQFPTENSPTPSGPRFPERPDYDADSPPRKKGGLLWLWLLLGFVGFGFCCGGCVVVGVIAALNGRWEPYTADGGAFTAEFPTKPVHQEKTFKWKDDTSGKSHEYASILVLQGQGVGVHYADLPKSMKPIRPTDKKLLKLGFEDFKTNSANFSVQSETFQTIGKYEVLDIEGTMTDPQQGLLQVSLRVMIVGDRVFTLIAAGKDRKKMEPMRERFFKSFKPAEPKEAPAEKEKDK